MVREVRDRRGGKGEVSVARPSPRVLSLFSGIGGLDLGVRRVFPDAEWVAYVEREAFAAGVLAARVSDGSLAPAPLYAGDVRKFPAADLRGRVDLVTAGFPCPPVSHAGKRRGTEDERWLWPEVARVLRETEAGWILVENVSGLLSAQAGRAFGGILADLDALGFDAEWTSVRASDVGAPHRRERVFVLGRRRDVEVALGDGGGAEARDVVGKGRRTYGDREADLPTVGHRTGLQHAADGRPPGGELADAPGDIRRPLRDGRPAPSDGPRNRGMGNANRPGLEGLGDGPERGDSDERDPRTASPPEWPPGPGERDEWASILAVWPELAPATVESGLRGVARGGARRLDRLRALGNIVVPQQAELAIRILHLRLTGEDL